MTLTLRAAAIVAVVAIYALRLDRTAGLMVDDAWYILLAKSLAQGDGYRLISSAVTPIMPVVPPGFPLLLAPVFVVRPEFPDNVLLLKAVSIAAMFGAGALFYSYLVRQRAMPAGQAGVVALATVLTPGLVFLATSTVMPESVFTLTQLATVVLLERGTRVSQAPARDGMSPHSGSQPHRPGYAALAGVMAAATMLIRTAGVAALAAGALYLIARRSWRAAAAFTGAALICLVPWFAYSAAHAPTRAESAEHGGTIAFAYSDLLSMRQPSDSRAGRANAGDLSARVARNIVNVFGRDAGGVFVPAFFRGPDESGQEVVALGGTVGLRAASMGLAPATIVVSFILSAVVLLGVGAGLRRGLTAAHILVAVTVAMVLLVPGRTFRYVLPIAPFLWMYLADGLRAATRGRAAVVRIALFCLIGLQLLDHGQYVRLKMRGPPPEWLEDQREVDELLSWMASNLPGDGAVATTNPGLVYLRTGRKTLAPEDPEGNHQRWKVKGVRYLVSLSTMAQPSNALAFRKLYDSPRRQLFVIELSDP